MVTRPVSDLQNNLPEIERIVQEGSSVSLTEDGKVTMVIMSHQHFNDLHNTKLQKMLGAADFAAEQSTKRLTFEDVFGDWRDESKN